ncbi:MAG: hypothetical protein HY071_05840 [Chloroflexi bacterium]|nr:hypothetical protein [Chloroflexota bacterium]
MILGEERRSDPRSGALFRAGIILTGVGVVSAASVLHTFDAQPDAALAIGFAAYLGLMALAVPRTRIRHADVVAFLVVAAMYLSAAFDPGENAVGLVLYVGAMALAFVVTRAPFRPLAVAGFALWTPALRFFDQDPFGVGFPPFLAIAGVGSLVFLVATLIVVQPDGADRMRSIGYGLLGVACVSTVIERHTVVASLVAAPDDLMALVIVVALPILASVRFRASLRDALAIGLVLATYVLVAAALILGKPYHVDVVAIVHRSAELALQGKDPYVALDVSEALAEFGLDPTLATHLENGEALRSLNYPALSFLVPAPFIAAGLRDVRVLYLTEIVLLTLLLLRRARVPWRPLIAATIVGNVVITRQFVLAGVDPLWAAFVAVAYLYIPTRWLSPVALGLACAARQPAWFFVPFYLLAVWKRDGRAEAGRRAVIVFSTFAVPDLPYLLMDPGAFVSGILTPIVGDLEPYGVGLVRLAINGVIPLLHRGAYAALSIGILASLLLLLWRRWQRLATGSLAFPLVPLWFAWRSLQNYFAFVATFSMMADSELMVTSESDGLRSDQLTGGARDAAG